MSGDTLLGGRLNEYLLEDLLGQGGMARVYRGLDLRLQRYVAVKVIDSPYRHDSEYKQRFEREAQAVAQLDYPHIVRLYRYGEQEGLLYMVMQYVEGSDLETIMNQYEADGEMMDPADIRRLVREICQALDYAHSRGVIHRDVKPANIMLDMGGRAIVADFGLALLTDLGTRGEVFGSPHYIAPEQAISSAAAVPQTDLYAVGVILYRMFTGVLPFEGIDPLEVALRHVSEPPAPPRSLRPEISPQLEAVILKALAKEPADRYAGGEALAGALDAALAEAPALSKVAAPTYLTIAERVSLDLEPLPPPAAGAPVLPAGPAISERPTAPSERPLAPSDRPTAPLPAAWPAPPPAAPVTVESRGAPAPAVVAHPATLLPADTARRRLLLAAAAGILALLLFTCLAGSGVLLARAGLLFPSQASLSDVSAPDAPGTPDTPGTPAETATTAAATEAAAAVVALTPTPEPAATATPELTIFQLYLPVILQESEGSP
jgi:eukaryotic-like serine/threonine-protein kinase